MLFSGRNHIAANVAEVESMMKLVWWSNQAVLRYNVWPYNFPSASTSLPACTPPSEAICQRCVDTSSAAAVSSDAFQVMNGCWHAHSHIITQPQSRTPPFFFCHTCTLIFTYILQPTQVHNKLCQQQWKYGAHFKGADHVLEEEFIFKSSRPRWFGKTSRASSCVWFLLFLFLFYQRLITSLQVWINSYIMQPGPRWGGGPVTGSKSTAPKAEGLGSVWI